MIDYLMTEAKDLALNQKLDAVTRIKAMEAYAKLYNAKYNKGGRD